MSRRQEFREDPGKKPVAEAAMTPIDAALDYARRGWPVCPWKSVGDKKFPLTEHGHLDATIDEPVIIDWWQRWPNAIPAIATGERSNVVALDTDIRPTGSGFDSLEGMGIATHPVGPTAHTPRGGCAVLFKWPGHFVKTSTGELAPHLDIKADRGSLILPPGPGRYWDPHLGLDTPIAPMPDWMKIPEPEKPAAPEPVWPATGLSPYASAALDGACRAIISACAGAQEKTLHSECFSIGTLAGAGAIPADFARRALLWAAEKMPNHDHARPWRASEIEKKVNRSFDQGTRKPREAPRG
jgi:hypothetical protein